MKIVHKEQAKEIVNSESCVVGEYPLGDNNVDGAVIRITGRYPNEGQVVNLKSRAIAYIIEGSGQICVGSRHAWTLQAGDLVLIEPGEKYFWEGNLIMFMSCTPPWSKEQYKEVE